jgi:hypothetical protein
MLIAWFIWRGIDAWGNVEFVFSKAEGVRSAFSSGVGAIKSFFAENVSASGIQWVLLIGGLAWVFIAATRVAPSGSRSESPQLELSLSTTKRRDPKKVMAGVAQLLVKTIRHGDTLSRGDDRAAMRRWDENTLALVSAIWGAATAEQYSDLSGYVYMLSQAEVLAIRIARLQDWGRRLEFNDPPILESFIPEQWGYDPSAPPQPLPERR